MWRWKLTLLILAAITNIASAEPTIVVLPFDPVMDSLYTRHGKTSILNYQTALQEMLTSDMGKYSEIRVIELSDLDQYIKLNKLNPERWNNLSLAAKTAADLNADYAVIGSYGEYTTEIRVDARIVVAASAEVPHGFTASSTVGLWNDLPSAASGISAQIIPILTASGRLRPTSKGILFPEGDMSSYDPAGDSPLSLARLVVWVNTPAPEVESIPPVTFERCERIDRMNIPADAQKSKACKYALLPTGKVELKISQRGYLPYNDSLNLAAGKVYRLEVNMKPIEQMPR